MGHSVFDENKKNTIFMLHQKTTKSKKHFIETSYFHDNRFFLNFFLTWSPLFSNERTFFGFTHNNMILVTTKHYFIHF